MPYIPEWRRIDLEEGATPDSPGELNYAITDLITRYLWNKDKNYQHINDVVGALEGAKQEFYRRIVGPYEDKKIKENGDVYPDWLVR